MREPVRDFPATDSARLSFFIRAGRIRDLPTEASSACELGLAFREVRTEPFAGVIALEKQLLQLPLQVEREYGDAVLETRDHQS